MIPPKISELIRGIPASLGSYGPVIEEIERAMESPQCNLVTVGEAIEKDPDLTARLLRLANSPFYGFSSRVATVAEAISLIGIQQVQDLIEASSIVERFAGVSAEQMTMKSFWRHCLAVGVASRLIAMEVKIPKAEKLFVAGMLHDIGRLVLLSEAPECAQAVFELYGRERLLLREAETRVMGYDHQQIAAALLREWRYPAPLVETLACHHQPLAAGQSAAEAAAVIHLADFIVHALDIGNSGERCIPPLYQKACDRIRFQPASLSSLITRIEEQIQAVEDLFLAGVKA